MLALFGLLLAFTFSSATTRFGERRDLITAEANAIGTAYLRLDLLNDPPRATLRDLFKRYVEARLHLQHTGVPNDLGATQVLQTQIWATAVDAVRNHREQPIASVVLDPINQMFDQANTRWMASRAHLPVIIFVMLYLMAWVTAFLAGHAIGVTQRRHWAHVYAFVLSISGIVYVILDIEYPRAGFIRVDRSDSVLQLLLDEMQAVRPAVP